MIENQPAENGLDAFWSFFEDPPFFAIKGFEKRRRNQRQPCDQNNSQLHCYLQKVEAQLGSKLT